MPSPCQIVIEGIQAGPPYVNSDQPSSATVVARASDCHQVQVVVRITDSDSQSLADQTVTVDFSGASTQPGALPGLITWNFPLPPELICGDKLFVEVTCIEDRSCSQSDQFTIDCKPDPHVHVGTGQNGGTGHWWPPTRCMFTAAGAAMALMAALACIAIGVGIQNAATFGVGIGLIATASISWALWAYWCGPALCVRLAVLCWVFKRGFIAALPVLFFSSNTVIILVIISYGTIAGVLVNELRKNHCPVPSAGRPLTQIPI